MKFLVQRVKKSSVEISGEVVGRINHGFLVLIGITHDDNTTIADKMIKKLINLRVFEDENGKMNKSILDVGGSLLLVSQFTLYGDCSHGNRPSFINASKPDMAKPLYEYIIEECKKLVVVVQTGEFGADMKVDLINDGPVTIMLDSKEI